MMSTNNTYIFGFLLSPHSSKPVLHDCPCFRDFRDEVWIHFKCISSHECPIAAKNRRPSKQQKAKHDIVKFWSTVLDHCSMSHGVELLYFFLIFLWCSVHFSNKSIVLLSFLINKPPTLEGVFRDRNLFLLLSKNLHDVLIQGNSCFLWEPSPAPPTPHIHTPGVLRSIVLLKWKISVWQYSDSLWISYIPNLDNTVEFLEATCVFGYRLIFAWGSPGFDLACTCRGNGRWSPHLVLMQWLCYHWERWAGRTEAQTQRRGKCSAGLLWN